jgi:hypothetical protein
VLFPWVFWREVTVETPIAWRGVVRWLACLSLLTLVLPLLAWPLLQLPGIVWNAVTAIGPASASFWVNEFPVMVAMDVRDEFADVIEDTREHVFERDFPTWLIVGVACLIAFPVIFLLLPYTRRASKVRAALVARASAYSLAWLLSFAAWHVLSLACATIDNAVPWTARRGPVSSFLLRTCETCAENTPFMWAGWWSGDGPPAWLAAPVAAWIGAFWLFAMKRSWRMPDWRAAWLACAAVALVLCVFAVLTDSSLLAKWY